jgi:hypothetical protein
MLFRSPLTRWTLILSGVFAGVLLAVGPDRFRETPSLTWLAQAHIPLRLWGVALVVYALLLAFDSTRPLGYAAGAVLWAVFTLSIIATIPQSGPKSSVGIAAFIDVTAFHVFSIRTAWAQKLADP